MFTVQIIHVRSRFNRFIEKRVEFAQENNGDIFVSIHANGSQYKMDKGQKHYIISQQEQK